MSAALPLNTDFIKARRAELQLTQAEAATRAGFPNPQKWSQYENGRIPDPQLSSLEAIARAMECRLSKLIRD